MYYCTAVTVEFQQTSYTAYENQRTVDVCMTATGSHLTRSVQVFLTTLPVNATGEILVLIEGCMEYCSMY